MEPTPAPRICSVDGCGAPLRASNTIGRCRPHSYVPAAGDVCGADGCETVLRKDNTTGFCTPHKRAKNRPGPVPKRKFTARVYSDRACPDCGDVFTPGSATQQRCGDCRGERKRDLRRKQEWDICSVPGCAAHLRTTNTTGRCSSHRNFIVRDVCAADGCDRQLREDNDTGYCKAHKYAKAREPVRPCGAPGCDRVLRTDNTTGYCPDHAEHAWRTPEYLANKRATYHAEPKPPDTRRTCYIDGCDRKIRSDNTSGRCSDHTYVPLDLAVCSVDGCRKRLNSGNPLGRCMEHRGLYWADDAPKCAVAGCGKTLHRDNQSGLCKQHYDATWSKRNNRAYYDLNQVELREYARQYREVYADEHRAAASAWNAANREARYAAEGRRKSAADVGMDDIDRLLAVCYRLAILHDPCAYCGTAVTHHVDHFFPLAKGGSGKWFNLCRTCQPCNNAKYTMCGTAFLLLSGG